MASRVPPGSANPRFSDVWPIERDKAGQVIPTGWMPLRYEYVSMEYALAPDAVVFRLPVQTLWTTKTADHREQSYPVDGETGTLDLYRYARNYYLNLGR